MIRTLYVFTGLVFVVLLSSYSFAAAEPVVPKSGDSPGLRLLEEIQTVITDLAESAKPSVVNLIPLSGPGPGRTAISRTGSQCFRIGIRRHHRL